MEDHDRSDNIGEDILGEQPDAIFKDAAASNFNNLRTEILMKKSDLVIALIRREIQTMEHRNGCQCRRRIRKTTDPHSQEEHHHALKELSRKAHATVETVDQAIKALHYIFE